MEMSKQTRRRTSFRYRLVQAGAEASASAEVSWGRVAATQVDASVGMAILLPFGVGSATLN